MNILFKKKKKKKCCVALLLTTNNKKLTEHSQRYDVQFLPSYIDDVSSIIEKNQASTREEKDRYVFSPSLNANRQTLISTTNTKALNTIGAIERQSRTIRKYGKWGSFQCLPNKKCLVIIYN